MGFIVDPFILEAAGGAIQPKLNNVQAANNSAAQQTTIASYALTAGSNRALFVLGANEGGVAVQGVDFGVDALTLIAAEVNGANFQSLFFLLEADFPVVETQDIDVNWGVNHTNGFVIAGTITDGEQAVPTGARIQESQGTSTDPADDTVTPENAPALLLNGGSFGAAYTPTLSAGTEAGAVLESTTSSGGSAVVLSSFEAATVAAFTMGYDGGSVNRWIQQLIAWNPVP